MSRSRGFSIRVPSGFAVGDHVVGIVRRPDPVPCPNCAVGEWDMCSNGGYTEREIKQVDGLMADRWRIEPEYALKVDQSLRMLGVLLEPTTVVAKAWEHIASIGRRSFWDPNTVLVVGAGPIAEIGLNPEVVVECTGVAPLIRDAAEVVAPGASCASPASVRRSRRRAG